MLNAPNLSFSPLLEHYGDINNNDKSLMLCLRIMKLRSVCNFISDGRPLLQCNSSK